MAQTYLQLVNKVLVNLRETTVASVASSSYAQLIGSYINEAKEKVEDAWQWRALTVSATWNTVAAQQTYLMDGTDPTATITFSPNRVATDRSYIIQDSNWISQVFALTSAGNVRARLQEWPYEDLIYNIRMAVVLTNQPPYAYAYSVAGGVPQILLARPPDTAYAMEARFIVPQNELSNDSDTLLVPYRPVVSYATFMAMQERGEELGTQADLYLQKHNEELARSITNDAEQAILQFKND